MKITTRLKVPHIIKSQYHEEPVLVMPENSHWLYPSPGSCPVVFFPGAVDLSGKLDSSVLQACEQNWHLSPPLCFCQFFPYCSSILPYFLSFHALFQPLDICVSPLQTFFCHLPVSGIENISINMVREKTSLRPFKIGAGTREETCGVCHWGGGGGGKNGKKEWMEKEWKVTV